MKTNVKRLVQISVQGQVSPHLKRENAFIVQPDGKPVVLPGWGGITYNVKIGDPAMGWVGDHIEPGVSVKVAGGKKVAENMGLNILACIGNGARVVSGEARGDRGFVTGKHGGVEHVLIYFSPDTLEKLAVGDKILVKSWGLGLEIEGLSHVKVMNLDPDLFEKIPLKLSGDVLEVPVVGSIPPELMGSGLGAPSSYNGDYDLTTADPEVIEELGLGGLRLGDLVALKDTDNTYGRCFKRGAVSIGVVVHSDCVKAGHGPGITTIFTSTAGKIRPVKVDRANVGDYLGITGQDS